MKYYSRYVFLIILFSAASKSFFFYNYLCKYRVLLGFDFRKIGEEYLVYAECKLNKAD